jgi:hypothetical protein
MAPMLGAHQKTFFALAGEEGFYVYIYMFSENSLAISPSSGNRPNCFLEKISFSPTFTSNTPPLDGMIDRSEIC